MKCCEVAFDADLNPWVCHAEKYTEHSHADPAPHMRSLSLGQAVALGDNDQVWMIELADETEPPA